MNSCNCGQPPAPSPALAIATVPSQPWIQPYDPAAGLKHGTIFPSLNLPFYIGGEKNG